MPPLKPSVHNTQAWCAKELKWAEDFASDAIGATYRKLGPRHDFPLLSVDLDPVLGIPPNDIVTLVLFLIEQSPTNSLIIVTPNNARSSFPSLSLPITRGNGYYCDIAEAELILIPFRDRS